MTFAGAYFTAAAAIAIAGLFASAKNAAEI